MFDKEMENSLQGLFMKTTHSYFVKNYHQLMSQRIHPGQIPMLRLLHCQDGLSQKEIAKRLHIKPPTVTVTLQRLEKSGYITRQPDEKDLRKIRIYLTEEGQQANERLEKIMRSNEKIMSSGFTESEKCLMQRFLKQLLENIESIPVERKEQEELCPGNFPPPPML